jgi:hypothetical protein
MKTSKRYRFQCALLVAIEDRLAARCTITLRALDLDVVEAAGPKDGGERIVLLQPAIVVVPSMKKEKWAEAIEERTLAAGSELVWLNDKVSASELTDVLGKAYAAVMARSSRE